MGLLITIGIQVAFRIGLMIAKHVLHSTPKLVGVDPKSPLGTLIIMLEIIVLLVLVLISNY
jgi:hypothetical protein